MLHILHESPILSVGFDETQAWLYTNWRQVHGLADVQTGCAAIMAYVGQTQCRRILNDNRQVATFWADAAEWLGYIYLPRLATAGVGHLAWINAHSIYGRLSTNQALVYIEHLTQPVTRLFDDYDEAVAWLQRFG